MRVLAGLMLVGLIACAPAPEPLPSPIYRNTAAQIASQTDVTADRMAGDWVIRQRFAGLPAIGPKIELSVLPSGALQLALPISVCLHSDCTDDGETLVLLEPTGPGRWTPVDPPASFPMAELWVMWMDFYSRTATIGTPSGEFGWIMDKSATGGGDRITAARDIMEWFGYDLAQLNEVEL